MRTRATLALAGLLAGALTVASGPATPTAACHDGSPGAAATALVHPDAWVVSTERVAGIDTVLVAEPTVAPFVRRRLVATNAGWCTPAQLNRALSGLEAVDAAAAFASLAPAPFFDGVEVLDVASLGADLLGEVVSLRTVARTNGVAADWDVLVDAAGIVRASFTTTGLGVGSDIEVQVEGVTSLPGHTASWARDEAGLLVLDLDVDDLLGQARHDASVARAAAPGDLAQYEASDGFVFTLHSGDLPVTPETAVTGVALADRHLNYLRYVGENYEEMLSWGIRDEWPDDTGELHVDGATAAICLACAYIGDYFEIHMLSVMPEVAEPLVGLEYEDNEEFVHGVIGHEMIHSAQGGYGDGRGGELTNAFIEGLARASEAIRLTATGTHQPNSIMYVDSGNGCNGFRGNQPWDVALANGPFLGHSYDACFFWLPWLHRHGAQAGIVGALEAMPSLLLDGADPTLLNLELLDLAAGDVGGDLAHWAVAAASGTGWTLPVGLDGEVLDWAEFLHLADAETIGPGGALEGSLSAGGVAVARLEGPGQLTVRSGGWLARVADGAIELTPLAAGVARDVPAPQAGVSWWIALVNDGAVDLLDTSAKFA